MMIKDSQQITTLTRTRIPRNTIPLKAMRDTKVKVTKTKDTTTQDTLHLLSRNKSNRLARNFSSCREYRQESPGSTRLSVAGSYVTESISWLDRLAQARRSSQHSFSTTGSRSTTRTGSTLC